MPRTAARTAAATAQDIAEPVARIEGLHVGFTRNGRPLEAVRGVDLEIRAGEVLGLVGESGSGKSVLGLSLLGLLPDASRPRTSGTVRVAGTDMLTASPQVRRQVRRDSLGAVFQDPMTSLNPTMRIGRQVAEAAGSGAEALRLLRAVGIPEPERRLDSFPHELSGGLRQRVMIAMAVAGDPALLIADEPTTALDVTVQAQVLSLLRRLRDDVGCSVLLITHDLGVAAQVADRVAVMYAGRIAEVGPTAAVLQAPMHPYTVGLIRSRLSLGTERGRPLGTLEGGPPDPSAPLPGCSFAPRCALATGQCRETVPDAEDLDGHARACFATVSQVVDLAATVSEPLPAPEPRDRTEPASVARLTAVEKTFRVRAGRGRRARLAALRRVSLDVRAGEAVAIVGESGSGKSTLLRVLAGLETRERGDVGVGTRPQMVFQDAGASLTPWLTVGELLDERLRTERPTAARAARRERAVAALDRVGLPAAVYDARAGELSGGQRQRVALARAVVVPPDVLLADEPTSALDVNIAATVLNLLQSLRRELGIAVLLVTHDLSVARIVADRIAVMYLGRIVEIGAAEELIRAPKHPYTKALLAAVPDFGVTPTLLDGEPASPLSPPSGCAFHPRCALAESACADADLDVPLELLRHGTDDRRVACIRPKEL
ncbi:ABC transporter ATP-binding protein [Pseudonocardia sp. DSM 110487]|uniref:dipeptide ABC transporter ATP-binding protein n=1 Tax=Pseudonocardia sp. DSM 110487 TaxID=2865833 RepID=UPI001C694588|nr:ABC transporter ATP-binding protein [Pseudonocardia sp. DSM 110487]QYN39441.1 ABC transporter ATP-binding protein [Pseudonocardia sp. DSM 110487]